MGVLPEAHGHGVGTALLAAARQLAREAGLDYLALGVWRFNEGARAFYEALGFATVREEPWAPIDSGMTK